MLPLLVFGPGTAHPASDTAEDAGDVLRLAIPAAAFALTLKRDDRDGRRQFVRSFAANAAATLLLKEAIDDERPDGSDDDAFPSGHASMAFQGAAFLHRRYGIRTAWPAYALATFVAWSRVDADEHDEADVLGGALLGAGAAFLLTKPAPQRSVMIAPTVGPSYAGVVISGRF